jgi:hypothetical protein
MAIQLGFKTCIKVDALGIEAIRVLALFLSPTFQDKTLAMDFKDQVCLPELLGFGHNWCEAAIL